MLRCLIVAISVALLSCGCSRSPAEQLAYLHAEQQYRINMERSARYHAGDASEESAASNELPFVKPPSD